METESVGSIAGVQRPRSPLRQDALGEVTLRDAFPVKAPPLDRSTCRQEGHLSPDCPKSNKTGPGTPDRRGVSETQCRCGLGSCVVRTSRTEKNPGRLFYACPGKVSRNLTSHFGCRRSWKFRVCWKEVVGKIMEGIFSGVVHLDADT